MSDVEDFKITEKAEDLQQWSSEQSFRIRMLRRYVIKTNNDYTARIYGTKTHVELQLMCFLCSVRCIKSRNRRLKLNCSSAEITSWNEIWRLIRFLKPKVGLLLIYSNFLRVSRTERKILKAHLLPIMTAKKFKFDESYSCDLWEATAHWSSFIWEQWSNGFCWTRVQQVGYSDDPKLLTDINPQHNNM